MRRCIRSRIDPGLYARIGNARRSGAASSRAADHRIDGGQATFDVLASEVLGDDADGRRQVCAHLWPAAIENRHIAAIVPLLWGGVARNGDPFGLARQPRP